MSRIYLDHAATTPMLPEVVEHMAGLMGTHYGNPSSIHAEGRQSRAVVEEARKVVARCLNASLGEIFFTSGGTESNNMALRCAVRDLGVRRIVSSPVEHHCVLHVLEHLDVETSMVRLRADGTADLGHLGELLDLFPEKTLVSLMHVNNELGTANDLAAIARLCAEKGALLHCDTVQGVGFFEYDLSEMPVQFISGSAHKFHGPKGVGFIYISNEHLVHPVFYGGSQERNMRAGTENIAGISGMAMAMRLAYEAREERMGHLREINAYMRELLEREIPGVRINSGDVGVHHPKILSVSFPASARTDLIVFNLDIDGIAASGGSACSSGVEEESHVLEHLGLAAGFRTVRFSFSHSTTRDEIDRSVAALKRHL